MTSVQVPQARQPGTPGPGAQAAGRRTTRAWIVKARRWVAVAVAVSVLAALPWAVSHVPRSGNPISAGDLLARIHGSAGVGYSGYAESVGTLALPVTSQVSDLDDLLGGRTSMRVWWRGDQDWRVDQVDAFGESDVHRDTGGTWTWNYESNRAIRSDQPTEPAVRIPVASDMLPAELGRRLLSEATSAQVRRLPVRRIAGLDAPGLRLSTDAQSSVDHVDVYADPASGLPVQVDVHGRGTGPATVTTSFLDLQIARPAASATVFTPPAAARTDDGFQFDPVSAANRFFDGLTPDTLAGLTQNRTDEDLQSVGVYGRGVTELVALPLGPRTAGQFSRQLTAAGALEVAACSNDSVCHGLSGTRQEATVGPLSLLLLQAQDGQAWAVTGTVLPATLRTASDELLRAGAGQPDNQAR